MQPACELGIRQRLQVEESDLHVHLYLWVGTHEAPRASPNVFCRSMETCSGTRRNPTIVVTFGDSGWWSCPRPPLSACPWSAASPAHGPATTVTLCSCSRSTWTSRMGS